MAGLVTASRVYPTCGTLKSAEFGHPRIPVPSTSSLEAQKDVDARHKAGHDELLAESRILPSQIPDGQPTGCAAWELGHREDARLLEVGHRPLLSRPMNELALDQQKHEIEAVAEPPGGKDRRVHIGHGEQLLCLEHALAQPIRRADEHLRHDH